MKLSALIDILKGLNQDAICLVQGSAKDEYSEIQSVVAASLRLSGDPVILLLPTVDPDAGDGNTLQ